MKDVKNESLKQPHMPIRNAFPEAPHRYSPVTLMSVMHPQETERQPWEGDNHDNHQMLG